MKIISQAPCRISLYGGGTDIPTYASKYGGVVFNMAINIRQKVIMGGEHKLLEGDSEEFFNAFSPDFRGFDCSISHKFDGHMESGLGSSAALAVSLIGAMDKYKNTNLSKDQIAEMAWNIEVNELGLFGGKQDQYAAVYGGVNVMEFNDKVTVTQLPPSFIEPLLPSMILFYTGKNRRSGKIQEAFKELSKTQIDALNSLKQLTYDGVNAIANKDIYSVGKLLDYAWQLKKQSNAGTTNDKIDAIYQTASKNGAIGGKILGAGGGGHILFVCPPDKQEQLKEALTKHDCTWTDFGIDFNGLETRII